tara:strand:+ start:9327 stop:10133 length:807 start_codon:yes stop_codon:yes gene_type:complete
LTELTIISLGAGVQSSAMALMSAKGELPPVDHAIFADTGAEPRRVYDYLLFLQDELPFPIHVVKHKEGLTKGLEDAAKEGKRVANPPLYTDSDGEVGILNRQCTLDYKINPIKKKVRELLGLKKGQHAKDVHCTQWIGISLDEIQRMKLSMVKYITHVFPLVDKRMNRNDCLQWMKKNNYPEPPRSACVYCPYHSDNEWRLLRDNDPEGWQEAIRMDELLRDGTGKTKEKLYVHQQLKPLKEVDLTTDTDRGQTLFSFQDECEGMCGM